MARITRRSYKRKRIVLGVALFMSVALISSGFAAFVISSTATGEGNGNVSVGTVSDKALTITLDSTDIGSIIFDTFQEDKQGNVRSDDTGPYESLSVTVSGTIGNYNFLGGLNFRLQENGSENMLAAANAGYIELPTCMSPTGVDFTDAEVNAVKNNEGRFSYTVTFGWGDAFAGLNPGEYFDNETYSNGTWTDCNPLVFTGSPDTIQPILLDFRKTVYGADSDYNEDTQYDAKYQGPSFTLIITATSD
ncbi:MAG: hypothetical protein IJZ77_03220 [Bacilli bacterium]|nr:hypothetical protein [Bacilli bacterium]